ncbi:MAG TPA: hypothetical protein VKG80_07600 [Trebonia sp.]|nr:hypothetical protein [Trebonia sp.]
MTRRYTSGFDILGFDTDPTPGDPDLIMSQIVPTYQSIGDDAEAALNALNSNAIEGGAGQTMQALQNLIGTSYPPKLQTAADSYHAAATVYTAYAQALTEAQNQLDRAMDQAAPVAAVANTTVQPAPPSASADQVAAVQQQQQSVDQANDQLTAAKQLAQDAADMRTQAGNTFNTNLDAVTSIPDLSWWQKFLNWFENSPIFQIIVDVAVAIVSIFCPVVGLVLGAVAFGAFTAFNTIANGHFDVGAFVVGVATLAFGGAVAFKAIDTVALFSKIASPVANASKGIGSFFSSGSGNAIKGITDSVSAVTDAIPKSVISFAKTAGGNFAYDSVTGFASNGIGDAIDHKQFTGQDAEAIVAGAAAGGIVAGGAGAAKTGFGFDPVSVSGDDGSSTSGVAGSDVGHAYPDDASSTYSTTGSVAGSDVGHAYPDDASSPQTPGSPGEPSYPNPPHPEAPSATPSLQPDPAGQQTPPVPPRDLGQTPGAPTASGAVNKPLPLTPLTSQKIGNAFNQAGRFGNDVADGGVQIAVGQAIGNTTDAQQEPPGFQAGQDARSDLPALAAGSNINPGDIIDGLTAPFKGE